MSIELELEKMGENSVRASKDIRSLNERDKNNILKSIIVSLETVSYTHLTLPTKA